MCFFPDLCSQLPRTSCDPRSGDSNRASAFRDASPRTETFTATARRGAKAARDAFVVAAARLATTTHLAGQVEPVFFQLTTSVRVKTAALWDFLRVAAVFVNSALSGEHRIAPPLSIVTRRKTHVWRHRWRFRADRPRPCDSSPCQNNGVCELNNDGFLCRSVGVCGRANRLNSRCRSGACRSRSCVALCEVRIPSPRQQKAGGQVFLYRHANSTAGRPCANVTPGGLSGPHRCLQIDCVVSHRSGPLCFFFALRETTCCEARDYLFTLQRFSFWTLLRSGPGVPRDRPRCDLTTYHCAVGEHSWLALDRCSIR